MYVDSDGAITEAGYAQIRAVYAQVAQAQAHVGGRLAAWHRMLGRNQYTVDPVQPAADCADHEQLQLIQQARIAVSDACAHGLFDAHSAVIRLGKTFVPG